MVTNGNFTDMDSFQMNTLNPDLQSTNQNEDTSHNHFSLMRDTLKDTPTLSINCENVNSPNSKNIKKFNDDEFSSLAPTRSQYSINRAHEVDGDQLSIFSTVSRVNDIRRGYPILTTYSNKQIKSASEQSDLLETEIGDILKNDADSALDSDNTTDVKEEQISILDLLNRITKLDSGKEALDLSTGCFIGPEKENNEENEDYQMPKKIEEQAQNKPNSLPDEQFKILKEHFLNHKKQYFVLSSNGKPIYSFFGSDEIILNYAGIIQTLISSFGSEDLNPSVKDSDSLKYFKTSNTQFLILNKSPIYLLAISSYPEESQRELKGQLYLIYNFLLSLVSKKQLLRYYSVKSNFDLRSTVINDTDTQLLSKLIITKVFHPSYFLNGIEPFYLNHSIKLKINSIIDKQINAEQLNKDILYGILSDTNGKIITIAKHRNHLLHILDIQNLFSIIFSKSQGRNSLEGEKIKINKRNYYKKDDSDLESEFFFNENMKDVQFSNEEELWFPICLPEFNANGFLYCFVNYIDISNIEILDGKDPSDSNKAIEEESASRIDNKNKLVFIILSPNKNAFFNIRKISQNIILEMILNNTIWKRLNRAFFINQKMNYFDILDIFNKKYPHFNITNDNFGTLPKTMDDKKTYNNNNYNFFHFIFKSKKNSQLFIPNFNSVNVLSIAGISFEQIMLLYKELANTINQNNKSTTSGLSSSSLDEDIKFDYNKNNTERNSCDSGIDDTNNNYINIYHNPFTNIGAYFKDSTTSSVSDQQSNDQQTKGNLNKSRKSSAASPKYSRNNSSPVRSNIALLKWVFGDESIKYIKIYGLAYSNPDYEIYIILRESTTLKKMFKKNNVVENLKFIINWIFKNFNRLFITGLNI